MRFRNRIFPIIVLPLTIVAAVSLLLITACGRDNKEAFLNSTTPTPVGTIAVREAACDDTVPADVTMQNEAFSPQSITRSVNAIVKWTNTEPIGSNSKYWVVFGPAENPLFKSLEVGPGKSICLEFTKLGTYNYHCDPTVTGTVIIEPAPK